ncbi:MAG: hypothetical protein IJ329_00220 [Clostridia bacterium]|nr:hypothetical protein [Clostridia bacterium]
MTKFDVYAESLERRRTERRNAEFNERLSLRLKTKTHEEAVAELMNGLTVILGVGNVSTESAAVKNGKTLVF